MPELSNNLMTPATVQVASEILAWLKEFVAADHPSMQRPTGNQSVCPFVAPALEEDSIHIAMHPEVTAANERYLELVTLDYIDVFDRLGPFDPAGTTKKALLVIFPNLPERETNVLDVVQRRVKTRFVQEGLMLGQFHSNCKEVSVHNRAFLVSASPHPFIAIRHMAIHDILFLADNREWFQEYHLRFGEKFRRPQELEDYNKYLLGPYSAAKEKWQIQ